MNFPMWLNLVVQSSLRPDFTRFYIGLCSKVISGQLIFFWHLIFVPKYDFFGQTQAKMLQNLKSLELLGGHFLRSKHFSAVYVPFQAFDKKRLFGQIWAYFWDSLFLAKNDCVFFCDFLHKQDLEKLLTSLCNSIGGTKEFSTGIDPYHTCFRKEIISW